MSVRIFNYIGDQEVEVLPDKDRRRRVMNGPRPNFRNDLPTITIKVPDDLVDALADYSKENSQSAEEACLSLIRTGLQSADQSNADEIGENDPDNQGGNDSDRMKEHQSIKETRGETVQRQMQCEAEVQELLAMGRFDEARRVEKLYAAYGRHVTPKPTDDEQRNALVDSIVRLGTEHFNRRH
jgi:hypothetical protein